MNILFYVLVLYYSFCNNVISGMEPNWSPNDGMSLEIILPNTAPNDLFADESYTGTNTTTPSSTTTYDSEELVDIFPNDSVESLDKEKSTLSAVSKVKSSSFKKPKTTVTLSEDKKREAFKQAAINLLKNKKVSEKSKSCTKKDTSLKAFRRDLKEKGIFPKSEAYQTCMKERRRAGQKKWAEQYRAQKKREKA